MKLRTDNDWTPMMFPSFPAITEDVWRGKVPMCRRDFEKETGCQWTCIYDEWKSYIGHSNIKPDGFVLNGVVVPDHKHHIYLIANEMKIITILFILFTVVISTEITNETTLGSVGNAENNYVNITETTKTTEENNENVS